MACGAAEPEATPVVESEETEAPTATTETVEEDTAAVEEPAEEEETAVPPTAPATDEIAAAATVDEAAVLRPSDWVKGAETPSVTIIEYGDFQ